MSAKSQGVALQSSVTGKLCLEFHSVAQMCEIKTDHCHTWMQSQLQTYRYVVSMVYLLVDN